MAKNPRHQSKESTSSGPQESKQSAGVSSRGKKVIAFGIVTTILGYWVLTFADPAGQNWAGRVSPFILVLGYALIGVGIVTPDPDSPSANLPKEQK